MCGIFGLLNFKELPKSEIMKQFQKGVGRGPEFSILKEYQNLQLGFHRLAINGLNDESNQPFELNDCILVCNGEIYNFKELALNNDIKLTTQSDCEIIIHMYRKFGIEYTLNILDGVFAFILYDLKSEELIVSRDPYGVRPLYYYNQRNTIGFASELKVIYNIPAQKSFIKNFLPGTYMIVSNIMGDIKISIDRYTSTPCRNQQYNPENYKDLYRLIYNTISGSVKKRVLGTTERPIGCLLSGGLDSSLVACLVNKEIQNDSSRKDEDKILNTFSIGLEGSEDLKYARKVAEHIKSNHHEIVVSEEDFFNAIPEVIKTIESYDTTTVRASVGNYLVAKYIKENTDCKVIFNGDGADELMGGYLYMKKAPDYFEFDKECRRLLKDIYMFDVLRSDRSISSHGLEPRTPFLDRNWVEFYLTIDKKLRYNTTVNNCEKYLLRKSISEVDKDLMPSEILWRTKEAFSDGVSSLQKSWYEIIQERVSDLNKTQPNLNMEYNILNIINLHNKLKVSNNIPETHEQGYYRYLWDINYRGCDHLIEYYWMPKYIKAKDASARTLNIYNENNSNKL